MPTVKLKIDLPLMHRQVTNIKSGLDAMIHTAQNAGQGQVVASKRSPKKPWEKKAFHGRAIANFMRARGVEPITYDDEVAESIETTLQTWLIEALDDAWKTAQSQAHVVKSAFLWAAEELADNARERLYRGAVSVNTQRTSVRKQRLAAKGFATTKGGPTPPYGVETGRFADGIRGIWKKGRPRGGRRSGGGT